MKVRKIAVVIGGGNYNELGLIRSCGEVGMKVIFLSLPNKVKPVYRSRYVSNFIEYDGSEKSLLRNLSDIYQQNVDTTADLYIYPATDIVAKYLDSNYAVLKKQFHVPHACGRLEILMDKECQCRMMKEVGIQTPQSLKLILNDGFQLSKEVSYPCIVKPLQSIGGNKGEISVCTEERQLMSAIMRFKASGCSQVLVQEYIHEPNQTEIAIPGVATETGEVLIHGTIRKKRIYGNGSTVCGCYDVSNAVPNLEQIRAFIRASGYVGLFDMEFLLNDKGLWFIECNFRNGAYGYAVTSAGFNMPAAFAQMTDDTLLKLRNRRFMEERADILHPLQGKMTWCSWLADVVRTNTFLWTQLKDLAPMCRKVYGL